MVADRDVLVPERDRGLAHLEHARLAVRPRRVHVQVAAHVVELEQERRRFVAMRTLAELGRAPRHVERRVHARLVGCTRQRLQCPHVVGRAGRTNERGPERLRRRNDEFHGHTFDGDADRAPLAAFDNRNDLRKRLEGIERRLRLVGDHDDGQVLARVLPAPRVAGDLSAQRLGDPTRERPCAVEEQSAARLRLSRSLEAGTELCLGLRADPRHRAEPTLCDGRSELVRRPHAERLSELPHPFRPHAEQLPEPHELRHQRLPQLP